MNINLVVANYNWTDPLVTAQTNEIIKHLAKEADKTEEEVRDIIRISKAGKIQSEERNK